MSMNLVNSLSKKQANPIIPNDNPSEYHQTPVNRQKGRKKRIYSYVECVGEFDARVAELGE